MGRVKRAFGSDTSKWYITKHHDGRWAVCPPITDCPDWHKQGGAFNTGAEALAAFAAGGRDV